MSKEVFDFNGGLKRKLVIAFIVGAVLLTVGALLPSGGHEEAEGDHTELASAGDHGNDHAKAEKNEEEHGEESGHDEGSEGAGHDTDEASHGEDAGHEVADGDHEEGGHEKTWLDRFKIDFWINNIYFTGLALIGLF